ncbi:hypothetical protein NL676_022555 [Syzygium grande]|nr:hypothetical protein NL676_022555 [Syzygium grande]
MSLPRFLKLFSFPDCFSPSYFVFACILCFLLPVKSRRPVPSWPSVPVRRCRLHYVAVGSASWSSAPPCGRRFRLVLVRSALWPWALLIAVGSTSSPRPHGRRLRHRGHVVQQISVVSALKRLSSSQGL